MNYVSPIFWIHFFQYRYAPWTCWCKFQLQRVHSAPSKHSLKYIKSLNIKSKKYLALIQKKSQSNKVIVTRCTHAIRQVHLPVLYGIKRSGGTIAPSALVMDAADGISCCSLQTGPQRTVHLLLHLSVSSLHRIKVACTRVITLDLNTNTHTYIFYFSGSMNHLHLPQ